MTQALFLVPQSMRLGTPAISCLVSHLIGYEKLTKHLKEEADGGLEWGGRKSLHEGKKKHAFLSASCPQSTCHP